ncbi:MAG: M23 family metallopeptidase [Bacteroidales bacterium]|nr:M23 family metallopeptidase [Bacteroidales bacterium]
MQPIYTFDPENETLIEAKHGFVDVLLTVLGYLSASIALGLVLYLFFALFFNTDTERRLRQENRMYSKFYKEMVQDDKLLSDVITGLEIRDNEIYREIFKADAPSLEMLSSFDSSMGIMDAGNIESLTLTRLKALEKYASGIEDNFMEIFAAMDNDGFESPPMSIPLKDFNYSYVGASVGMKINPFYKVLSEHNGIDLITPAGTDVHSAGEGVVLNVTKSGRREGNVVEVRHNGGYVTRYLHLDKIYVRKGSKVNGDSVIGTVGVTGVSFAPHLHFEMYLDGEVVNPVNYFFADLLPEEYAGMMLLAATIGQSMD